MSRIRSPPILIGTASASEARSIFSLRFTSLLTTIDTVAFRSRYVLEMAVSAAEAASPYILSAIDTVSLLSIFSITFLTAGDPFLTYLDTTISTIIFCLLTRSFGKIF